MRRGTHFLFINNTDSIQNTSRNIRAQTRTLPIFMARILPLSSTTSNRIAKEICTEQLSTTLPRNIRNGPPARTTNFTFKTPPICATIVLQRNRWSARTIRRVCLPLNASAAGLVLLAMPLFYIWDFILSSS